MIDPVKLQIDIELSFLIIIQALQNSIMDQGIDDGGKLLNSSLNPIQALQKDSITDQGANDSSASLASKVAMLASVSQAYYDFCLASKK